MIGIIDYDAGNIKSVEKALAYLGEETVVSRDPEGAPSGRQSDPSGSWKLWTRQWKTYINMVWFP